ASAGFNYASWAQAEPDGRTGRYQEDIFPAFDANSEGRLAATCNSAGDNLLHSKRTRSQSAIPQKGDTAVKTCGTYFGRRSSADYSTGAGLGHATKPGRLKL